MLGFGPLSSAPLSALPSSVPDGTFSGTSYAALPLGGSISGCHGVAGTVVSAALPLSGSAAGAHGARGSMSGALPLTGSIAASHGVAGASPSQALPAIGGSASGAHGEAGTVASAALVIAGSASGCHGVAGTSSQALSISGSISGRHGVSGTTSSSLPSVGGSATGTFTPATVTGTSSAALPISGSSSGGHGVSGVSVQSKPLGIRESYMVNGASSLSGIVVKTGDLIVVGSFNEWTYPDMAATISDNSPSGSNDYHHGTSLMTVAAGSCFSDLTWAIAKEDATLDVSTLIQYSFDAPPPGEVNPAGVGLIVGVYQGVIHTWGDALEAIASWSDPYQTISPTWGTITTDSRQALIVSLFGQMLNSENLTDARGYARRQEHQGSALLDKVVFSAGVKQDIAKANNPSWFTGIGAAFYADDTNATGALLFGGSASGVHGVVSYPTTPSIGSMSASSLQITLTRALTSGGYLEWTDAPVGGSIVQIDATNWRLAPSPVGAPTLTIRGGSEAGCVLSGVSRLNYNTYSSDMTHGWGNNVGTPTYTATTVEDNDPAVMESGYKFIPIVDDSNMWVFSTLIGKNCGVVGVAAGLSGGTATDRMFCVIDTVSGKYKGYNGTTIEDAGGYVQVFDEGSSGWRVFIQMQNNGTGNFRCVPSLVPAGCAGIFDDGSPDVEWDPTIMGIATLSETNVYLGSMPRRPIATTATTASETDFTSSSILSIGAHGVAGTVASAALLISGSASGTFTPATVTGTSSASLPVMGGASSGSHGVSGASSQALPISGSISAGHGVAGSSSVALSLPSGSSSGARGVAGAVTSAALIIGGSAAGTFTQAFEYLTSGVPVNGSVGASEWKYYLIDLPSGTTAISIALTGLTGDLDLFANDSATPPTLEVFTAQSGAGGLASEYIDSLASQGTWCIGINGYEAGDYTIVATAVIPVTGASSGSILVGGSAAGAHGVRGSSSASPVLNGSIAAVHGVGGSSSVPLPLAGSIMACHGVAGASSGALSIQGSASGIHAIGGPSSAALVIAGAAAGAHGVSGTSTAALLLQGSIAGAEGEAGTSSLALPSIQGSASGAHGVRGSVASSALVISGSASGVHPIAGSSSAALPLSGSISARHGVSGTSSTPLPMGGSIAAGHGVAGTSSASFAIDGTAQGSTLPLAYGTSTAALPPILGSASGLHGVAGLSSLALTISGSASGSFSLPVITGTSSVALPLGGSAVGRHGVAGASNAPLPFSGTAVGTFTPPLISGTSSASISLLGSSSGAHGVAGTSQGGGLILGAAVGAHGEVGTSAGSLGSILGQISAVVGVAGWTSGSLVFDGSADGFHVPFTGASSAALRLFGSADGVRGVAGDSEAGLVLSGSALGQAYSNLPPAIIGKPDTRARRGIVGFDGPTISGVTRATSRIFRVGRK
jgi:hypothetical protein